jgi:transposase InsO family protein
MERNEDGEDADSKKACRLCANEVPKAVDLAILRPRPDLTPVVLAQHLKSSSPFAILMPIDLVPQVCKSGIFKGESAPASPKALEGAFRNAGTLTFLESQVLWVVGNVPSCDYAEMFAAQLVTPAPLLESFPQEFVAGTPATLEQWIQAQKDGPHFSVFVETLSDASVRGGLHIFAPDNTAPKILVPDPVREDLVRSTHVAMHHLGSAKVALAPAQSRCWPSLSSDCRKFLRDCAGCELEKAKRNEARATFSAAPSTASRSRLCMDFQGQGKATTGESEALAITDAAARHVVVMPLHDRHATSFIPKFLDGAVFRQGPPETLHSDSAQEFLSGSLELLAETAQIQTTTALGHDAAGNSLVEVFWRCWSRCMRILPDDMHKRWPELASRICFAYNSAPHSALGNVSPVEIHHGVPSRNPFAPLIPAADLDAVIKNFDLADPAACAAAVSTSVSAFCCGSPSQRLRKSYYRRPP